MPPPAAATPKAPASPTAATTPKATAPTAPKTSAPPMPAAAPPAPTTPTPPEPTTPVTPVPPTPPPPASDAVAPVAHTPPKPPADLPPPGLANEPVAIGGYERGLFLATRDDAFRVSVRGWLMARWEIGDASGDVAQHFVLPSSRLVVAGHAFSTIDYVLSTEVSSGALELRDAFIDQPLPKGMLRVGQFKPYFSHQQLMSRSLVTFTDRAPTFAFAGIYRDIGAALHHEPRGREGGVELAVGLFNGEGITPEVTCTSEMPPDPGVACTPPTTAVASGRPLATARIGFRSARVDADRDDDLDHGQARVAVGVGYAIDLAHGERADMVHDVTADVLFKAHGVSIAAAVFLKSIRIAGERTTEIAWHAQLGYVVVPHLLELAGRFSQVAVLVGTDRVHEGVAAVNVYRREHRLKWHIEGGVTQVTGDSGLGWVARVQTQLIF